jgi:asparaginyl-tRNA synthetase
MQWIYIEDIAKYRDQEIEVRGWVYNKRSSGKVRFLIVRDGTGLLQATAFSADAEAPLFRTFDALTQESSVIVRGLVREDKRAPGGYELSLTEIEVIQIAAEYPITPKTMDTVRWAPPSLARSEKQHAVSGAPRSSGIATSSTAAVSADGHPHPDRRAGGRRPIRDRVFRPESLPPGASSQWRPRGDKVCCSAPPSGRRNPDAPPSHRVPDGRARGRFATLQDTIELGEDLILFILERVLTARKHDLEVLERDAAKLEAIVKPFPRLTYDEALPKLKEKGSAISWGDDFGAPEETIISDIYPSPVCVTHFPSKIKAFYMQPDAVRPELALGVDFLASEGYGEIIGGGQRVHDPVLLEQRIKEHELPPEAYAWYVDLRKYGTFPHSFRLGVEERFPGSADQRTSAETIPFPRLLTDLP